jgi:hypothetical protein
MDTPACTPPARPHSPGLPPCRQPHCLSLLSETVDAMLQEVCYEAGAGHATADAFAFDLLVGAVAFSSGKCNIAAHLQRARAGAAANEAALVLKASVVKAGRSAILRQPSAFDDPSTGQQVGGRNWCRAHGGA